MMRGLVLGLLIGLAAAPAQAQISTQLRGRLELSAFVPDSSAAWLIAETEPFLAPRASLFAEAFAGERLYFFGELRADRGAAPAQRGMQLRVEQLFARFTPGPALDLHFQAGKFISPFGNYPGRSHSNADPLIRPPLNYDYRTVMATTTFPRAAAGFMNWKNQPEQFRSRGAPIVWAVPYQIGAMAFGSFGKAAYRLALMNSAPSSEPELWDKWFGDMPGPSLVAHVGYQLSPELRFGASLNNGPYLNPLLEDSLPDAGEFDQQLLGFELTAARGLAEVRAELLLDRWEVPRLTDAPIDVSYYTELKYKLLPGLAAAARYGRIHFRDDWDYDISRWQIGGMYHLSRRIEARAEYMINRGGTRDPRDNLFSLQAGFTF